MRRLLFFVCICCALFMPLTAQETSEEPVPSVQPDLPAPVQKPETDFTYKMNQKGDQYIRLAVSLNIPFVKGLNIGGAGNIGYSRFITNHIALGGEVSFSYQTTIGKNVFYYWPIIFKGTYQFSAGRFEFPLSLGIGFSFQSYLNRNYYGLIIKPEAAAYFRYSPDWSFGLSAGWTVLPQWYSNSAYNKVGNILDISASVRYHF